MYILIIKDNEERGYMNLLEALAHLCEQGGDVVLTCKQGQTAKTLAQEGGHKIAVVLLGMYVLCVLRFPSTSVYNKLY